MTLSYIHDPRSTIHDPRSTIHDPRRTGHSRTKDAQKSNPTMVFAFPLATATAQTLSCRRTLQCNTGRLHANSMNPSNVFILQVLMEIIMWFCVGKSAGFMIGWKDELPLLSNNGGRTLNFVEFCSRKDNTSSLIILACLFSSVLLYFICRVCNSY